MTIAEIESTLHTLLIRHPNLDEGMLITLLTAGGWEEKTIKEALVLFKSYQPKKINTEVVSRDELKSVNASEINLIHNENVLIDVPKVIQTEPVVLPNVSTINNQENIETETQGIVYYDNTGKEENILQNFPNDGKDLPKVTEALVIPQKIENTPIVQVLEPLKAVILEEKKVIKIPTTNNSQLVQDTKPAGSEPQSLIIPKVEARPQTLPIELPENLPMKPFDSTPHVWPFSKYKEIFHGETISKSEPNEAITSNDEVKDEHTNLKPNHNLNSPKIKLKRTGFDGEDEGLIFLTGTTLLIILLLLAYMYSNGRL